MMQAVKENAWKEIPVAYTQSTTDLSIPTPQQQNMAESVEKALENTGRKIQTFTVEPGHCHHFAATQEVVDANNKIAYA